MSLDGSSDGVARDELIEIAGSFDRNLDLPGSSVTFNQLDDLLIRTSELAFTGIASFYGKELQRLCASALTTVNDSDSVSEKLLRSQVTKILKILEWCAEDRPRLLGMSAHEPEEIEQHFSSLDRLIESWKSFLTADFCDEEVLFQFYVSVVGPRSKIRTFESSVNQALDDAFLEMVKDLPLTLTSDASAAIVSREGLQTVPTVLKGNALSQRINELGGNLLSPEQVDEVFGSIDLKLEDCDEEDEKEREVDWRWAE